MTMKCKVPNIAASPRQELEREIQEFETKHSLNLYSEVPRGIEDVQVREALSELKTKLDKMKSDDDRVEGFIVGFTCWENATYAIVQVGKNLQENALADIEIVLEKEPSTNG